MPAIRGATRRLTGGHRMVVDDRRETVWKAGGIVKVLRFSCGCLLLRSFHRRLRRISTSTSMKKEWSISRARGRVPTISSWSEEKGNKRKKVFRPAGGAGRPRADDPGEIERVQRRSGIGEGDHPGGIGLQLQGGLPEGRPGAHAAHAGNGRRMSVENPFDPAQNIDGGSATSST